MDVYFQNPMEKTIAIGVSKIINKYNVEPGNENIASRIYKNLWLGNKYAAADRAFCNNISHIVNATTNLPNSWNDITYLNIPITDGMACESNLFSSMMDGAVFIHDNLSMKKSVLVHCKRGHHRSASIVALYLMIFHGSTFLQAVEHIKIIRPTAFRRMSCMMKELIKFEAFRIKNQHSSY